MRITRCTALMLVAALIFVALVAGCSADTAGETDAVATSTTVVERDLAFSPPLLEVSLGDTVTFTNEDSVDHQLLIDGVTLGRQSPGRSVTWTPTEAATIDYICTLHPEMRGRIVVK